MTTSLKASPDKKILYIKTAAHAAPFFDAEERYWEADLSTIVCHEGGSREKSALPSDIIRADFLAVLSSGGRPREERITFWCGVEGERRCIYVHVHDVCVNSSGRVVRHDLYRVNAVETTAGRMRGAGDILAPGAAYSAPEAPDFFAAVGRMQIAVDEKMATIAKNVEIQRRSLLDTTADRDARIVALEQRVEECEESCRTIRALVTELSLN